MEQVVGIRMNGLTTKPGEFGTSQEHGATRLGMEGYHMAEMAACFIEALFALDDIRVVYVTTGWYGQALHIEVDTLHIFCPYIEHIIRKTHHRAFLHLNLTFADFLRITAIGHTHIRGETQFYRQVGMVGFITRESELAFASLSNIVTASADTPLGIVALARQGLNLVRIERHHLSHTYVAQRHTNGAEKVFGLHAVGIPLGNGPAGHTEGIFLTIGEAERHRVDFHFQLAFRAHAIDGLIVDDTSVIREERTILSGDINKRRGKAIRARTIVATLLEAGPVGRFCTTCIAVTTTTTITSINRAQATTVTILVRVFYIIV